MFKNDLHEYYANDTIFLDSNPPYNYLVTINGGAAYTNSTTVQLTLSATDDGSGVGKMRLSYDASHWTTWIDFSPSKTCPIPPGDGLKTIYAQFRDVAGNETGVVDDSITLDGTAPYPCSIRVTDEQGIGFTNSTTVLLELSATDNGSGVGQMQFSNDGSSWSALQTYAPTRVWTLTPGGGTKTVYARFLDNAGNTSGVVSGSIIMDTAPPYNCSVTVNSGSSGYTKSTSVGLTFTASDDLSGVGQVRCSNDGATWTGWQNIPSMMDWTIPPGEGLKTVYAQFRDRVGNVSGAVSGSITLDTTSPDGTVVINGDNAYTASPNVTLTLNASDNLSGVAGMNLMQDGSSWANMAYSSTYPLTLTAGDGTKTVYAQFIDGVGNVSETTYDTIVLDTGPPTGCSVKINNGAAYTKTTAVTLNLAATDAGSGMTGGKVLLSNDGANYTESAFAATKAWTLPSVMGTKTVYAKFKDAAGNVTATAVTDTIILDTRAPTGTIAINGGAACTKTTAVILNLSATDSSGGLDKMQFSNNNSTWSALETYATTKAWTLASGDGTKTVYARFTDKAGNVSAAVSDSIILDATGPAISWFKINGGAPYTRSTGVTLATSATDATIIQDMRLNNGSPGGAWGPFTAAKSWTLAAGDGTKTVFLQLRDILGNESTAVSAAIVLDATPPKDGTLKATAGNKQVTLAWSGFSDATSGLSTYRLYYGTAGVPTAATGTKIYEGAALTFTQKNLANGQPCYYRLVAVDKAGNVSAGATAAATPQAGGALPFLELLLGN